MPSHRGARGIAFGAAVTRLVTALLAALADRDARSTELRPPRAGARKAEVAAELARLYGREKPADRRRVERLSLLLDPASTAIPGLNEARANYPDAVREELSRFFPRFRASTAAVQSP